MIIFPHIFIHFNPVNPANLHMQIEKEPPILCAAVHKKHLFQDLLYNGLANGSTYIYKYKNGYLYIHIESWNRNARKYLGSHFRDPQTSLRLEGCFSSPQILKNCL